MGHLSTVKEFVVSSLPFVVYGVLYMFSLLSSVVSLENVKQIVQYINSLTRTSKCADDSLTVPHHMAVLFDSTDLISLECVVTVIGHAVSQGVQRLTFFDPSGFLKGRAAKIEALWEMYVTQRRPSYKKVIFWRPESKNTWPLCMEVNFLDKSDGKSAICDTAKQLCTTDDPITVQSIRSSLERCGVYEVDFLVQSGCANSLAHYCPWALRTAELHTLPDPWTGPIHAADFRSTLAAFAHRDRRLGR